MNRIVFLILVFAVCLNAQTHSMLDDRTVLNFNYNWGAAYMDTLHTKDATDTLILSGSRSGYNCIVQPLSGDVYIKLSGKWTHWWKVIEGSPFSFSGGERDTVYVKTAAADSSVVQIMWTAWN